MSKVILGAEDKQRFKTGITTLSPVELLTIAEFVNNCGRFSSKDLRFMNSCIGQRCERLLKNAATKFNWEGR